MWCWNQTQPRAFTSSLYAVLCSHSHLQPPGNGNSNNLTLLQSVPNLTGESRVSNQSVKMMMAMMMWWWWKASESRTDGERWKAFSLWFLPPQVENAVPTWLARSWTRLYGIERFTQVFAQAGNLLEAIYPPQSVPLGLSLSLIVVGKRNGKSYSLRLKTFTIGVTFLRAFLCYQYVAWVNS